MADIEFWAEFGFDFGTLEAVGPAFVDLTTDDKELGEQRRLRYTEADGGDPLSVRAMGLLDDFLASVDGERLDPSGWKRWRAGRRAEEFYASIRGTEGMTWCHPCLSYGERTLGTLTLRGRFEMEGQLPVEPHQWYCPVYRPDDWLLHQGNMCRETLEERPDEAREKISRCLALARSELAYFERLAAEYERVVGEAI